MKLPKINFDCKHFYGWKPCFANKEHGMFCSDCTFYEKDEEIKEEFPPIEEIKPEFGPQKKILIIKLDAAGDVLRTTSVLPSIKEYYPESYIVWITKEKSFPLLKDNELIDEIYFDTDSPEGPLKDKFDVAINLDSGLESCSIMSKVESTMKFGYSLFAGKPYPLNNLANEWYLMGVNDHAKRANRKTYHQIIHDICGMRYRGSKPQIRISPEVTGISLKIKSEQNLDQYDEFILVNLGGGERWQYKRWTAEGYSGVVDMLSLNQRVAVGIVAGYDDIEFYNEVSSQIPGRENILRLGCLEEMKDFIALINLADKILTSDSLGFHIATALGKYAVCFTGPTSYTELDVFGNGRIIHSDQVDCLCCYLNRCNKKINCMNTLSPEKVYLELTGEIS